MKKHRVRLVVGACALAASFGCTTRQLIHQPQQFIATERPGRIWVDREGTLLEVAGPRLLGDTLVGFFNGVYREVPVSEVGPVMADRVSGARTALLIGGIAATLGLASYALWGGGEGDPNPPDPEGEEVTVVPRALAPAGRIPLLRLYWP